MARDRRAQAYRNIRYASAARFGKAKMVPLTNPTADSARGPVSPQRASRLENVMGSQNPNAQDEHCQVLSVFTPSRSGKRPVMVFIHGGAFVTGGGELPWYDGDKLAAEQDVVVVTITYRLGVFGFYLEPDSTGPSPGLSDQISALEWVKVHISQFGGDPENVTLFGQSAGGFSILSLIEWGYGQRLFHRAILQSASRGQRPLSPRKEIEAISRQFDQVVGRNPVNATIEDMLDAQVRITALRNGDSGFRPCSPDVLAAINVATMNGWTREDLAPLILLKERKPATPGDDLARFREATKSVVAGTLSLARNAVASGQKSFVYEFAWAGPDTGVGNCHTIELPFLLGNRAAWAEAPMLRGANWAEVETLGRRMRTIWANFARIGDPSDWQQRNWPVYSGPQSVVSLP